MLRGEVAGALTALLWQKPQFSVVATKKKKTVVFKFHVPVPHGLRQSYPGIWELFWGTGIEHWKKALSDAYWHGKWGDKELHHSISNHLHVVYRDALGVWPKASLALSGDGDKKSEELQAFYRNARIKRSQPDPWLALWVAERIEYLQPAIKEFRIKLKKGPHMRAGNRDPVVQAQGALTSRLPDEGKRLVN